MDHGSQLENPGRTSYWKTRCSIRILYTLKCALYEKQAFRRGILMF